MAVEELLSYEEELLDTVDGWLPTVPRLWLLVLLFPLTYSEVWLPEETAGLLYDTLLPVDAEGFDVLLPEAVAAFCLVTVLLTAELPPEDFDAVTLLREVERPPRVPRPVLLLDPTPRLTVVFPLSVNTRLSLCVS